MLIECLSLPKLGLLRGAMLPIAALIVAGCGESSGPGANKIRRDVIVTVTYQGKPLTAGLIDFQNPATGDAGGGQINNSGKATISNLPVGSYTVSIQPPPVVVVPGVDAASPPQESASIPQKYRTLATSPLKAEITDRNYKVEFDLKAD